MPPQVRDRADRPHEHDHDRHRGQDTRDPSAPAPVVPPPPDEDGADKCRQLDLDSEGTQHQAAQHVLAAGERTTGDEQPQHQRFDVGSADEH